jgi:hypothetical protein
MTDKASDGTSEIKGTNYAPQTRGPRQMGKSLVAGGTSEVIGESQYPNGDTRHGINPANVHTSARDQHYTHPDGVAHRARERSGGK